MIKQIKDEWDFNSACDFFNNFPECKDEFIKQHGLESYNIVKEDDDFYDALFTISNTTNDEDFINSILEAIPNREFINMYCSNDCFHILELDNE